MGLSAKNFFFKLFFTELDKSLKPFLIVLRIKQGVIVWIEALISWVILSQSLSLNRSAGKISVSASDEPAWTVMFRNSLKMWLGGKSRKSSSGQSSSCSSLILSSMLTRRKTPILHTQESLRTFLDLMGHIMDTMATFIRNTDSSSFLEQAAEEWNQTDQRSEWWKDSLGPFPLLPSSTFVWQRELVGLSSVCISVGKPAFFRLCGPASSGEANVTSHGKTWLFLCLCICWFLGHHSVEH